MAVAIAPAADRAHQEQTILLLPLDVIDPAPDNPRRNIGDVGELAQSIASIGLLEPLVVTPRGDRYLLVCGARRHAGAKLAGVDRVPSIVRELDETERILAMAIENLQRVDLSPIEEARAYKTLVDVGLSQRDLAARVGRSQGHISKRLTLLELPKTVVKQLDSGGITVALGLELTKLAGHPERIDNVLKDNTVDGQVVDLHELEWEIEQQLAAVAREKKVSDARAALEAAGITLLKSSQQHYWSTPNGAIEISAKGGWDSLKLDPVAHANEPCHAAAVDDRGGTHFLCTNRKRHPKLKTESEKSLGRRGGSPAQTAQSVKQKKVKAAAKARCEFITATLVGKRVPQADLVAASFDALIRASHSEALKLACRFLNLEPIKPTGRYASGIDYATPLRMHAAKGERQRNAVLVAVVAGTHEEFLSSPYMSEDAYKTRGSYFELLERNGYTPDEFEAAKLGRKKTTRKKAA